MEDQLSSATLIMWLVGTGMTIVITIAAQGVALYKYIGTKADSVRKELARRIDNLEERVVEMLTGQARLDERVKSLEGDSGGRRS